MNPITKARLYADALPLLERRSWVTRSTLQRQLGLSYVGASNLLSELYRDQYVHTDEVGVKSEVMVGKVRNALHDRERL